MHILLLYRGGGSGGDGTVPLGLWDEWLLAGHRVTSYAIAVDYCRRAETLGKHATPLESWLEIPEEVVRTADAVHLHLASEYATWTRDVRPLQQMFGASRLFCTAHGPKPLDQVLRSFRNRLGAIRAARKVNRIVVPSQHKVREWQHRLPSVKNLVRISNPVYEPRKMSKHEARKELGLREDVKLAGFVGLLRPEKGVMTALEALSVLRRPDLHLVVAGGGPEEERLRGFAKAGSLNVTFTGYVADPSTIYRASDLFLFPSTFDNFPIALMQAAICDLPMVASDIPVVRDEFAEFDAVRRVRPGDSEEFAKNLARLTDELPLAHVGLAEVVRRACGPAEVAGRYVDLFNEGR